MEVTFELTQEMIENELLSIYYNTFAFNSYGSYMKSPLGCNFMKHLNCDYAMKDYWAEKINPLKVYSIDIFETPFGKYVLANYADQKNISDGGVFKLTNSKGRKCLKYIGSRFVYCDGWKNPCGHVDMYSDVANEYIVAHTKK